MVSVPIFVNQYGQSKISAQALIGWITLNNISEFMFSTTHITHVQNWFHNTPNCYWIPVFNNIYYPCSCVHGINDEWFSWIYIGISISKPSNTLWHQSYITWFRFITEKCSCVSPPPKHIRTDFWDVIWFFGLIRKQIKLSSGSKGLHFLVGIHRLQLRHCCLQTFLPLDSLKLSYF